MLDPIWLKSVLRELPKDLKIVISASPRTPAIMPYSSEVTPRLSRNMVLRKSNLVIILISLNGMRMNISNAKLSYNILDKGYAVTKILALSG
jgi:hypothetical protein